MFCCSNDRYFTNQGGVQGEGPALFHAGDRTYMLMSGLTGWNPNPANLISTSASRLCGASWQQHANPASTEGGNTTFDSQSTHVLPLTLDDGSTLFVYMGDRWNFKGPGSVRLFRDERGKSECPLCSCASTKTCRGPAWCI